MRMYAPPRKHVGGPHHLGSYYKTVMEGAKKFARSKMGKKLTTAGKRTVLQAGSTVLNNWLAGKSAKDSLKSGFSVLKNNISKAGRQGVKRAIFGEEDRKKRKVGGLTLYRLKRRRKKFPKPTKPFSNLLYKLSKKKRRGRRKGEVAGRPRKKRRGRKGSKKVKKSGGRKKKRAVKKSFKKRRRTKKGQTKKSLKTRRKGRSGKRLKSIFD